MKFYHVRPKSSLKEQRLTVKDLIVTFFLIIFLSVRCRACGFDNFRPHTTTYDQHIERLRLNLPTDYNLTVFLQDTAGLVVDGVLIKRAALSWMVSSFLSVVGAALIQDSCCVELQAMLSLNQSIGHLYHHSMDRLQNLTFDVLQELSFLTDCPVRESFNCEMERWNSSQLLRNLMERFRSFDTKFNQKQCNFERCTLYTCVSGHIETTLSTVAHTTLASVEEAGTFANGSNASPTTNATVTASATNRSPPLNNGTLATETNRTNRSPPLNNGTLATDTNGTNRSPPLNNGTLATDTNGTNPSGSLATGTNPSPSLTNETVSTRTNRTNGSSTSLNNNSDGIMAATLACSTDPAQPTTLLEKPTVAIILVASILANMMLLGCLLKRNRRPAPPDMTETEPPYMTEMEPLSSTVVELEPLSSTIVEQ